MSHKNHCTSIAPVLAIIFAMAAFEPAHAQMLVFDPSNYSQNLLTAARSLQQIQNQIKSLQNEAQMLIGSGKAARTASDDRAERRRAGLFAGPDPAETSQWYHLQRAVHESRRSAALPRLDQFHDERSSR